MRRDGREFYGSAGDDPTGGPPACERAEELVAYLYDEADADGRRRFELHAGDCASCREELTAFGGVRRAVAAWRAEALTDAPAVASSAAHAAHAATSAANAAHEVVAGARRKPSAVAALREFFALSPAWLRASAASACVAVVALAALTLARAEVSWGEGGLAVRFGAEGRVVERRVEVPAPAEGFTREQVEEIANARVASALAEHRARVEAEGHTLKASGDKAADVRGETKPGAATRAKRRTRPAQPARRDKRMLADSDDALPRLSDILSVAN